VSAATDARDEALMRVQRHANTTWLYWAAASINKASLDKGEFTADDVWEQLDEWQVARPHEPRALAPVLIALAKAGVIEATDKYRQSKRVSRHAGPVRVWRRVNQGRLF